MTRTWTMDPVRPGNTSFAIRNPKSVLGWLQACRFEQGWAGKGRAGGGFVRPGLGAGDESSRNVCGRTIASHPDADLRPSPEPSG